VTWLTLIELRWGHRFAATLETASDTEFRTLPMDASRRFSRERLREMMIDAGP
jgi:hypothetical protein